MTETSPDEQVRDRRARYRHLEPPLSPDQYVTTYDIRPVRDEGDDRLRETEWLLRTAPG